MELMVAYFASQKLLSLPPSLASTPRFQLGHNIIGSDTRKDLSMTEQSNVTQTAGAGEKRRCGEGIFSIKFLSFNSYIKHTSLKFYVALLIFSSFVEFSFTYYKTH